MKRIILSADSCLSVYSVPDFVADDLRSYIDDFYRWIYDGQGKEKYFNGKGWVYNETAFIDYLNDRLTGPRSSLVERLSDVYQTEDVPAEYAGLPDYNF